MFGIITGKVFIVNALGVEESLTATEILFNFLKNIKTLTRKSQTLNN